jgi:branched-chain amino acid aminotransferase
VVEVDGRTIGDGRPGPVTAHLRDLYLEAVEADVAAGAGPG